MARGHARIKTTIWKDDAIVGLTPQAQRVYFLLLSQPGLSFCGAMAYTPRRWAALAKGTTTDDIAQAVTELVDAEFVVVDFDAEEVWVRSFVKHDGVLAGGPKLLSAMWKDFAEITSPTIRQRFWDSLPTVVQDGVPEGVWNGVSDTPSDGVSTEDAEGDGIPNRMPRGRARPLPPTPTTSHQPPATLATVAEATSRNDQAVAVARQPDHLWDALVSAVGHEGEWTKSERGAWNAAAKQLRDIGATAEQVIDRCHAYHRRWPEMSLTPTALVKHWGELAVASGPSEPRAWADLRELTEGAL